MELEKILKDISAGILITDKDYKIVWLNKFEEDYYNKPLSEMIGLDVINCHKIENRASIADFLQNFKDGEMKEFTKKAHGMIITYSSYYRNGEFAGIVSTRIRIIE